MTQARHSTLPWSNASGDHYLRNAEGKTIADFRYKNGAVDLPLVCRAVNNHVSLLDACKAQHEAIDILLAVLVERDPSFMPTKSVVWPKLVQGRAAITKAEAF